LVKPDIIDKLKIKHPNLKRAQIVDLTKIIFSTITKALTDLRPVEIRYFGRYSIKTLKQRHNARNPRTNQKIYVPVRKKISFKMSNRLKNEINKEQ